MVDELNELEMKIKKLQEKKIEEEKRKQKNERIMEKKFHKPTPWNLRVEKTGKEHPELKFGEVLKLAKIGYVRTTVDYVKKSERKDVRSETKPAEG